MTHNGTRRGSHWTQSRCDCTSARHQREENRSHRDSVHRSGSERDVIKTWERMGFTREDLIATNLRLAAINRGTIYVAGRKPITVLRMGGQDLWMSFLVVENLIDSDQFILGRDFIRNFEVMIDMNNGLIRIRNPDWKYVKNPINRIETDENNVPIFSDRKVKLQPGQAVVAIFRMRNLNSLSDTKQVCLVPNPNSQSSVILGRSFSVTRNGLCVSQCVIEQTGHHGFNPTWKEI